MFKKVIPFCALIGLANISNAQNINLKSASKFANTITAADLKKHLTIVASDEMEGRGTATQGEIKAANYIAGYMKSIGLTPGNNGSYFQLWPIYQDSLISTNLSINNQEYKYGTDFLPGAGNSNAQYNFSEVVFINPKDTAFVNNKVNITGKLVLISPQSESNPRASMMQQFRLMSQLQSKGAAAVLIVSNNLPAKKLPEPTGRLKVSKYNSSVNISNYSISPALAQAITNINFADADAIKDLPVKTYKAEISLAYNGTTQTLESRNVLGIIEGTDLKDEYVVLTAHFDHEGIKDGVIYNGADDDGSGTVSILELAEAFAAAKKAGKGPRRTIVFMAVSGEEKGLLGSAYYGSHPVFPLEKTSVNLNIDMIGRLDSTHIAENKTNYVYIVGDDKLSTELNPITYKANKLTNLHLNHKYNDPKDPMRIYYRSDHYNFAKYGVPIIFYFNGTHADYHQPSDKVEKINFDIMEKRAKLVFYTAWEIANKNEMLKRDLKLPEQGGR